MSSQWVQHISGQGEKWEVAEDHPSWMSPDAHTNNATEWLVYGKPRGGYRFAQHILPKSEYILCDPPEQWVDITNQCSPSFEKFMGPNAVWNVSLSMPDKHEGYAFRLRKVRVYQTDGTGSKPNYEMAAFIVEKRVQP